MSYTEGKLERGPICDWELWIGADHHIADVHGNLPIRHANTDELIRRWNAFEEGGSHKDLLEACERAMRIKKLWCPDELYGNVDEGTALWTMHDTIKAAIAKAQSSNTSVAPER